MCFLCWGEILQTPSARTKQSQQQYGYNGSLPGAGSPTRDKPDLSRMVNGTQTDYRYYPWNTPAQGGRLQQSISQKSTSQLTLQYGLPTDTPIPADYNGDGTTDLAVFRPSTATWYVKDQFSIQYGGLGDTPLPADYDGDGDADIAVYRPSTDTFYVLNQFSVQHGSVGDIPVRSERSIFGKMPVISGLCWKRGRTCAHDKDWPKHYGV